MTLSLCRECKGNVSINAASCPHCGAPKPTAKRAASWGREYRSKTTVFGIPLFHFAYGVDENGKMRIAKGIVAVGPWAVGVVTLGCFSIGLIGASTFQLGLVAAGVVAMSPLLAVGSVVGGFDFGADQLYFGGDHFGPWHLALAKPWNAGIPFGIAVAMVLRVLQDLYWRWNSAPPAAPAPEAVARFLGETTPAGNTPTLKAPEADLAPGTALGPYRVETLLGRGGMGAVYRAKHAMLDRTVALKVLPRSLAADGEFVERFKREAQALAKLDHPNIVKVFDMGCEGETYFFAMELVDGVNLRRLLKSGGLAPEEALRLVPKLCDALEFAHGRGIIHRDIKPENILIGRDGEPRVADFGLARLVKGDALRDGLTRTNAIMGTPDYMAPEQRECTRTVDHRADIYSMGVVLYEMLTGRLPVGVFESPAKRVQVDVRIDSVVLKAMEREPELRYGNAAAMGTEVRDIASGVKRS